MTDVKTISEPYILVPTVPITSETTLPVEKKIDAVKLLRDLANELESVKDLKEIDSLLRQMHGGYPTRITDSVINYLRFKMPANCLGIILGNWKIGKLLGSGSTSEVYEIEGESTKRALKITEITNKYTEINEAQFAEKAGSLGIGPTVYTHQLCNDRDGTYVSYIVTEQLSGPTLDKTYPYVPEHIKQSLTLYHKLLLNDIQQNDLNAGNIMLGNGRLYIIDYGAASNRDTSETLINLMVDQIIHLIDSITSLMFDVEKISANECKERTLIWLALVEACKNWLLNNFPEENIFNLRFTTGMKKFDYSLMSIRPYKEELLITFTRNG